MRRLLSLTLVGAAAVAGGCGSSEDGDAGEVLYNAAAQTAKLQGAHLELAIDGGGQSIHMTGFQDFAGQRGAFTLTLPGAGDVDVVADGEFFYFRYPQEIRDGLGIDTEWASARTDAVGGGVFGNSAGFDARQLLDQMASAGNVEKAGEETIDGAHVTEYDAMVDMRQVPETVAEDQRENAQKALDKAMDAGLEPEVPLEVWVDDQGRVRRINEHIDIADQTVEVTVDLSDFGTTEQVTVPDTSTDITDKID